MMNQPHAATEPALIELWDQWHAEHDTSRARSALAGMALDELHPAAGKTVLELGCGQGADAMWFRERGATVIGTDISTVALEQARATADRRGKSISFLRHDLHNGLPQVGTGFDAIFARLSLQYFTTEQTAALFEQIRQALNPGGLFAFAVRSVNDPRYGEGEHLGGHMFIRKARIRHFFTDEYIEQLLDGWTILHHAEYSVSYESPTPSSVIEVMARTPEATA